VTCEAVTDVFNADGLLDFVKAVTRVASSVEESNPSDKEKEPYSVFDNWGIHHSSEDKIMTFLRSRRVQVRFHLSNSFVKGK
jgi:hypothetical protein